MPRRGRKGRITGLLGGEFTEAIEGARWPVHFAHGLQQQILQGGMEVLSREQSVAGGKQVNVQIRNVAGQADEASPQHHTLQPGDGFGDGSACVTFINWIPGALSVRCKGLPSSWGGKIATSISPAINASIACV